MNEFLRSSAAILSPGDGLLRNDHFQMAYVTNDIERACAIFSKRYGSTRVPSVLKASCRKAVTSG